MFFLYLSILLHFYKTFKSGLHCRSTKHHWKATMQSRRRGHHRHLQTGRQSWLTTQPPHNCRHFLIWIRNWGGGGLAITSSRRDCGPLKPQSPPVYVVCSSSARLTSPSVKNYTSPKLSHSATASHWLFPAAAAPENEWNWNSCYISCTIPGSAVLHSIILYQNGHSGTEPSKIVSKATFPQHLRLCVFLHAVIAFSDL